MTHQRGQREALKHARERPPVDQVKPSRAVKNKPGCQVFSERLAASHKIISTKNSNEGKSALEIGLKN